MQSHKQKLVSLLVFTVDHYILKTKLWISKLYATNIKKLNTVMEPISSVFVIKDLPEIECCCLSFEEMLRIWKTQ